MSISSSQDAAIMSDSSNVKALPHMVEGLCHLVDIGFIMFICVFSVCMMTCGVQTSVEQPSRHVG